MHEFRASHKNQETHLSKSLGHFVLPDLPLCPCLYTVSANQGQILALITPPLSEDIGDQSPCMKLA